MLYWTSNMRFGVRGAQNNKQACLYYCRAPQEEGRSPLSSLRHQREYEDYQKESMARILWKVLSGQKTYDLRLADWKIEPGDTLLLQEWDPEVQLYTGREISKKVGYVGKTKPNDIWTNEEIDKYGYQIISLLDE